MARNTKKNGLKEALQNARKAVAVLQELIPDDGQDIVSIQRTDKDLPQDFTSIPKPSHTHTILRRMANWHSLTPTSFMNAVSAVQESGKAPTPAALKQHSRYLYDIRGLGKTHIMNTGIMDKKCWFFD